MNFFKISFFGYMSGMKKHYLQPPRWLIWINSQPKYMEIVIYLTPRPTERRKVKKERYKYGI
ncbi:MAG: hypothetical protein DI535_27290 [Citrobacter freundii]|nr:MAG: hypothetical protein DI535_27290 [Citrobacter freundii]